MALLAQAGAWHKGDAVDEADVIDRFYEAAVLPELWPQAIEACAKAADAAGAVMIFIGQNQRAGMASPSLAAKFEQFAQEGGLKENAKIERYYALHAIGAQRDQDWFTAEEIETLPVYQTFKRFGLKWSLAFAQPLPGENEVVFSLERFDGTPAFDELSVAGMNRLKPHFARSVLTSTRLSLERMAITLDAFAALGVPAATIGHSRRLLSANEPFAALDGLFLDRRERLSVAEPDADRLLSEAVARLRSDLWMGAVGSIAVRGGDERPPMVLHVIPIRRSSHDIFANASALLVVSQVGAGRPLAGPILQALFDLTPAEARVAAGIGDAQSVEVLAQRFNLSRETVRGHLKLVFAKTGTRRQVELVHLLACLPSLGSGPAGTAP